MVARRFVLVALLAAAGCPASVQPRPQWPDAQFTLLDDADRDWMIDRFWALPTGAEREAARTELARSLARRIETALDEERPATAAALLDRLTQLWETEPTQLGRGLAPHVELLRRLRATFARSGALEPALRALVVLAEADPDQRAAHLAEIDEILAFADDLAIAENGANAGRAQPIALLTPTALAVPLPWLVDRYVTLLVERQRIVSGLLDSQGASMQLVRAHHDVLSTGRRIANVLARAGRIDDIYRRVVGLRGIGADRELTIRADVLASQPTPDAYAGLAERLRADDPNDRHGDPAAALAVCLAGLAKFPDATELALAASGDARELGRVDQAIQLAERALAASREAVDEAAALQLGTLYGERIEGLAAGGRPAAAQAAWRHALDFTERAARAHPDTVWQQAQAIAQASLGRGLASQGLVTEARRSLRASIGRAPSIDALETLTTVDLQTDELSSARKWVAQGLEMLGDRTLGDRYRRAKLERLDGDALRRAGRAPQAAAAYRASLQSWTSLGDIKELPEQIAAERRLEEGRAHWWLGDQDRAVEDVLDAVSRDADNGGLVAAAIAFLLEVGRYPDAVDAYHRGLGADLGDRYKVYMTLWIAGEAKHRGQPLDRLAAEFLASREGDTWYELLARAATGRVPFDQLRASATTGPRKAELAYYGAVLGLDPRAATPAGKRALLAQVVTAALVLDAEYDLARRYLALP